MKNKEIHFRGVVTSIMPIGESNIHIQINVSDFIMNHSFKCFLWF